VGGLTTKVAGGIYSAGTAFLQVVPSFRDVEDAMKNDLRKMGAKLDGETEKGIKQGMAKAAASAAATGKKTADDFSGAFNRDVQRALDKTVKAIPVKTGAALRGGWTKSFDRVRQDLEELRKEKVGFSIDEATFAQSVKNMRTRLLSLENTAPRSADFHNVNEARRNLDVVLGTLEQARRRGQEQAQVFTSAFERTMQGSLNKALDSVKPVDVKMDTSDAQTELQLLRIDMEELADKQIGVDLSASAAFAKIAKLEDQLRRLSETDVEVDVKFDAKAAADSLAKVLAQSEKLGSGAALFGGESQVSGLADQYADVFGSKFTDSFREAIDNGLSSIPAVKLKADATEAEQTLHEVRARLENLGNIRIGVDASAEEAYAELLAIGELAKSLDRDDVEVNVRVDARAAEAGIARFTAMTRDAVKEVAAMERVATLTMSRLQYLIALGASIGSVFVPSAAAAAGALAFMGTSAIAAAAGVGVLALGLHGVGDAIGAMQAYEDDQLKATVKQTAANRGAAGSTDAVANAVRNLGNVRRTVAEDAADAERAVADAVREANRARHDQAIEEREARRSLVDAQRDVTRAEADAREVREGLNRAIKEARDNLSDLRVELLRNEQDQSKAVTAQMRALNELHALQANPRASEVELREARDNVNEQTVRLEELAKKRREMQQEQAVQAAKGIEGDDKVIAARKRVKEADERVTDTKTRLRRAEEDAADKRLKAAQRVEDADRKIDVAKLQRTRQKLDGAYQIAQAQAQVAQAGRQQLGSVAQAAEPANAALDNLNIAMGKLTPAQRRFARFIFGLKDEFQQLRAAAADPMLPGFQRAIEMLLPYLPDVANFISRISAQLGSMAVQAARALQGPTWMKFFRYVDQSAVPAMQTWFDITNNLVDGLLNLYLSLTGLDGQIGRGLLGLSEDFARWAETLDKNQGYQEFIEYIRDNGPMVVHFFGELILLALRLLEAYAPIGAVALRVLSLIADGLNSIPMPILTAMVATISALALGIATLGAVLRAQKLKNQLGDIFGDSARNAVQKYAIDTGRATTETGRFRTTLATAAGGAAAMRDRMREAGTSIRDAGNHVKTGFGNAHSGFIGRMAHQSGLLKDEAGRMNTVLAASGGVAISTARKMGELNRKVGGVSGAFSSLGSFLGGPWGVAIAAVTVGATLLGTASAKYNGEIKNMAQALGDLGTVYGDLQTKGALGTVDAARQLEDLVKNSPELQQAAKDLAGIGVSFDTLGRAAAGNKDDIDTMMRVLDDQIKIVGDKWKDDSNFLFTVFSDEARASSDQLTRLRQMKTALQERADKAKLVADATNIANAASQRNNAITNITNQQGSRGQHIVQGLIKSYDDYTTRIERLNTFLEVFRDGQGGATERAQALRDVLDDETKSMMDATNAADDYQRKLLDLRDSAAQNGKTLDEHSRKGLANRDALKAAAGAVRELYIQDIAANKPIKDVTRLHNERLAALRTEAQNAGFSKKETEKLIKTYGDVPESVRTALENKNFDMVYNELKLAKFMQDALAKGWSLEKAKASFKAQEWWGKGFQGPVFIPKKATGGEISGPGSGTSDDVLMWGSNGEHMLTAAEVQAAGGHERIYAWRRFIRDGGQLPGYRHGGEIRSGGVKDGLPAYAKGGKVTTWPFTISLAGIKVPTLKELQQQVYGDGAGLAGDGSVSGSPAMERLIEGAITGARVTSAYRPGDGGYHGRPPSGRAIDLVFSDGSERRGGGQALRAFNYIASQYGKGTKELIWDFSPWGLSTGIWNGGRHRFRSATSGPGSHDDHLHWAYDDGGWMPPGVHQVVNMTGKPEPVLNPGQWAAVEQQNGIMEQLVAQANTLGGGGNTWNFEFRDTTLDAAWIRAQQQREDALMRVNRSR
jgi:hypothetical protein